MTKDAANEANQVTPSKNVSLVSMNIILNKSGTDQGSPLMRGTESLVKVLYIQGVSPLLLQSKS